MNLLEMRRRGLVWEGVGSRWEREETSVEKMLWLNPFFRS
jgi:hypothetical protein